MKVFEFLAILAKEKFPFSIDYIERSNSLKITVDTFSKIEIYEFNEDGITQHSSLIKTDSIEDQTTIAENIKDLQNRPERAWKTAAKDLGIRFISPYKFIGVDNKEYEAIGLLPDFGYNKGVLITSRQTEGEVDIMAEITNDYMLTGLNPKYYDVYDRENIIETLSEWGWIGGINKPEWLIENKE